MFETRLPCGWVAQQLDSFEVRQVQQFSVSKFNSSKVLSLVEFEKGVRASGALVGV